MCLLCFLQEETTVKRFLLFLLSRWLFDPYIVTTVVLVSSLLSYKYSFDTETVLPNPTLTANQQQSFNDVLLCVLEAAETAEVRQFGKCFVVT